MCALYVSSVCSIESGFKPAKHHGATASGHALGHVSLCFLQVTRAGKRVTAFLRYPQACAAQASHYSGLGREGLPVPFRRCCCRTGVRCPALRRLGRAAGAGCELYPGSSQPPIPSGLRGASGKQSPWLPRSAVRPTLVLLPPPPRCCPGAGESCAGGSSAPQLVTGHVPACGPSLPKAFHASEQGVGAVGAAGRKAQGAALFQL